MAQLTAHYDSSGTASRISTTWPGATIYGHRIGQGLRRLAKALPRWRHPSCHGRLLAHGHSPTTILTPTDAGLVRATVQTTPPPHCGRRRNAG